MLVFVFAYTFGPFQESGTRCVQNVHVCRLSIGGFRRSVLLFIYIHISFDIEPPLPVQFCRIIEWQDVLYVFLSCSSQSCFYRSATEPTSSLIRLLEHVHCHRLPHLICWKAFSCFVGSKMRSVS